MVEVKDNDFVEVDFDIYANGNLVQTSDEKKAKENNVSGEKFQSEIIVIGKGFILKALDEDIKKNGIGSEKTLELEAKDAYGNRQKDLIKTFTKSAFDEQKLRAVVGVTYDFNGMFGTVKSVNGGRVMVDFNNPLAGKDIKLVYKANKKVEDVDKKIGVVLNSVLRIPENMFSVSVKEKDVKLEVPGQMIPMKEMLLKSFNEFFETKEYNIEVLEKKEK